MSNSIVLSMKSNTSFLVAVSCMYVLLITSLVLAGIIDSTALAEGAYWLLPLLAADAICTQLVRHSLGVIACLAAVVVLVFEFVTLLCSVLLSEMFSGEVLFARSRAYWAGHSLVVLVCYAAVAALLKWRGIRHR